MLRVTPPWRRRARGVQEEPGAPGERYHWAARGLERDRCDCSLVLLSTSACPWPSHLPSPSVSPWEAEMGSERPCWVAVGALVGVQAELPPRPASVATQSRAWIWQVAPPLSTAIKSFALGCVVQTCKFAFDFPVRFHREDRCPIPALIKKAP